MHETGLCILILDSPTTDHRSRVYEHGSRSYNRLVERPYGSSALTSTALIRPSAVFRRSNTTSVNSVTTRTSSDASPSFDRVKASNATKNVSQLPRSTESQFFANANDNARKYSRSVSKTTSGENDATKATDLNALRNTQKPEYRKQTTCDSSSPSMKTSNINELADSTMTTNPMLTTSRNTRTVRETSSTVKSSLATISYPNTFLSESFSTRTQDSSVSMRDQVGTTPSVIENTVSPLGSTKTNLNNSTQTSSYVTDPQIPTFVPTTKSYKFGNPYYSRECNLLKQDTTLNNNQVTPKSGISETRKLDTSSTHYDKREIRDKYGFAGEFRTQRVRAPVDVDETTAIPLQKQSCTSVGGVSGKPALSERNANSSVKENQEQRTAAQLQPNNSSKYPMLTTSCDAKTVKEKPTLSWITRYPIYVSESCSTRTQHSSVSIHNRIGTTPTVIENTVNPLGSTKTNTTNTTQTSSYVTELKTPSFFPTTESYKLGNPYYSQECNLPLQGTTLNKNLATQKSNISETQKLNYSSTHNDKSEKRVKYGSAEGFCTQSMRALVDVDETTAIPPQQQTCTSVREVSEKPALSEQNADFYVKDFNEEKFSQKPSISSVIPKSYNSNFDMAIDYHLPSRSEESEDDIVLQPQFYLQNFTMKLQTSPKDKSFKPENGVVYHNQWTECSAQILDEFKSIVRSQYAVDVSSDSRFVDFRDSKIKKGRLHFRMRSNQTGNILVFVKIDNFRITKNLDVSFNPCSSSLSGLTIVKVDPAEDEFVFRVFIFDVFGEPIPSNSTVNLEVQASFHSTANEKVVKKEKFVEQEQLCYDITVRGERAWSLDLDVSLNGERLDHPQDFEFTDEECVVINRLDDEDYDWIQEFFEEGDCGLIIPFTTGEDDGVFVAYDENDCEIQSQNGKTIKLVCKDVRKYDILGQDFAHIDNIKRVLELKDRVEIEENADNSTIDLRNVKPHLHAIYKEVVEHLLRGLYYRWKASEAARIRMEWKNRLLSIEEVMFLDTKPLSLILCKYFKDFFGDLMNRYNREACDELFEFFNFYREENEVDLHGLLVADEDKLKLLRLSLMSGSLSNDQIIEILQTCGIRSRQGRERRTFRKKFRQGKIPTDLVQDFIEEGDEQSGNNFNVDAIISRCRLESDEAIRKLNETLDNFDIDAAIANKTPWLEIIVGAGRHSRKKEQNIRPKVEKLLRERKCKFAAVNKGSLVVTYQAYKGPEPCFGEYYCEKCDNPWKSSKSYVGKYQKCLRCKKTCMPIRQREKEKVENHRRESAKKSLSKPHQSSLCQRCQELGHPCNEDGYDSDY